MNKLFSFFITGLVCVGATLGMTGCGSEAKAADTTATAENVVEQEAEQVNKIDVFGNVVATTIRDIYVDFPATVGDIYVKKGEALTKGDEMVSLDLTTYKSQITSKESEIELLKIQLEAAYNGIYPESSAIGQYRSQISAKKALLSTSSNPELKGLEDTISNNNEALATLNTQLEITEELYAVGSASENDVQALKDQIATKERAIQTAQTSMESIKNQAQLSINSLQSNINSLQSTVSKASQADEMEAKQIEVKIATAERELADMKAKLEKAYINGDTIIADKEGSVVFEILTNEGSPLTTNDNAPILRLIDEDSLEVEVDVPESFINKIKLGDRVEVNLTSNREMVLEGSIAEMANFSEVVNGENMVKATLAIQGDTSSFKKGYEVEAIIYYE